jgi:hypothetical protein
MFHVMLCIRPPTQPHTPHMIHFAILHTSTKPHDPPLLPWLPDAQHT